jgi:hypothetical protein
MRVWPRLASNQDACLTLPCDCPELAQIGSKPANSADTGGGERGLPPPAVHPIPGCVLYSSPRQPLDFFRRCPRIDFDHPNHVHTWSNPSKRLLAPPAAQGEVFATSLENGKTRQSSMPRGFAALTREALRKKKSWFSPRNPTLRKRRNKPRSKA